MIQVDNRSPFAAEVFTLLDQGGQEVRLFVIAAAFKQKGGGDFEPVTPQPSICVADEHYGDPMLSSIRYEAELALKKPLVDVIVNGCAYAPQRRPATAVVVELHAGEIHKKLTVYGDRHRSLKSFFFSKPEPFVRMPIIYERAYGGIDDRDANPRKHKVYRQNPVGLGFRGVRCHDSTIQTDFPNIEYTSERPRSARSTPAGFGIIGRGWSPRLEFAGTYDEKWLKDQWPLMPLDFDPRHYQAAPPDQQSAVIQGGEEFRLVNFTPDGRWTFQLPRLEIPVHFHFPDRLVEVTPRLDTVLIEPDEKRVLLSARVSIAVERNKPPLRSVVVGHVTKGWLAALMKQKRYLDRGRLNGTDPRRRTYS